MSDTRERILDTASRLFHEQGYAATGVSTILREAGVNSGSLYHFFPSKEALLIGVLERYRRLLDPVLQGPLEARVADPLERVFALMSWYRAGMEATGCRLGCPIGNLALEVSDTYPEVRPLIDENFRGWTTGIRRWLTEAGDRLPASCDRDSLAVFILTVMEGGLMQARASGSLEPFDRSVAVLRAHVDHLVQEAGRPSGGQGDSAS
ncbi:MAG TPA: TetR/AcrR family transcriptional regulator [Phycisphaerales bacterium]|nr:TetR/AcrR family transcriptional regulator [Phycisphaerales bacterium]